MSKEKNIFVWNDAIAAGQHTADKSELIETLD